MPAPITVTMNFDSHIQKVVSNEDSSVQWTTSGQTVNVAGLSSDNEAFTVTLENGYVLDEVTSSDMTISEKTDTTFTASWGLFGGDIAITSKQAATPTLTFKHFYDAGTIGSGTYKFRHYSQQEPSSGETWVLNETVDVSITQTYQIEFVSNNRTFNTFKLSYEGRFSYGINYDTTVVYLTGLWQRDEYRTITFATPPTGDLLTWLQANGTKQGGGGEQ